MNTKQLLILILSLVGLTVILIIGFMVIYSTSPSFLGMSPRNGKPSKQDQKNPVPPLKEPQKLYITESDFIDLLRSKTMAENSLAYNQKSMANHYHIVDSLTQIIRSKDSINANLLTLQDSLKTYQNYLNAAYKNTNELRDSIAKIYKYYPNIKNSISKSKSGQNVVSDSLKMENIRQFASIYKNADPVKVAKILEKMDNQTAAEILKLLPSKQAGKIIDNLPQDKAVSILLLK